MSDYPPGIKRVQAKAVNEGQSLATKMFNKWTYDRISSLGENGLGDVIIRTNDDMASNTFGPDTYVLVTD